MRDLMKLQTAFLLSLLLVLIDARMAQCVELPAYETKYYTIYTDIDADGVREATIRMTKMAEEYHRRTSDFAGVIDRRLPFYLYKSPEDFYATGAPKTSGGYFNGRELVALAKDLGPRTWSTVQHEGFHQFARSVIRGDLPIWLNEGLAEYFGEGLFTGDGFVMGVIPQWRLDRIQKTFEENKFKPIDEMMQLTHEEWNADLAINNYDQGWSMVQYLAHGENGKYQKSFSAFMGELGQGARWPEAWKKAFGATEGFEAQWRKYWIELPRNPTLELHVQANTAVLASYLGRAMSQGQKFDTFEAFIKMAEEGKLKAHAQDWLPSSLLIQALKQTKVLVDGKYPYSLVLRRGERLPQIICTFPNGKQVIGKFTISTNHIGEVTTLIVPKKP